VPILTLIVISVISALIWHWYSHHFALATVGATTTSVVLYQSVAYLVDGAPGQLWLRALLITGVPALFVAVLVGWAIHRSRRTGSNGAL
jgi:D-alanyl-lipoteichoic acid acyltransferase DltB (MBOAT superfamily)